MGLNGMTGFGRSDGVHANTIGDTGWDTSWVWEARSVNGRGLDVRLRIPSGLDALDAGARARVQKRFARGSVALNLQLTRKAESLVPVINEAALAALLDALAPHVAAGRVEAPRLDGLLQVRGVMETPDDGGGEAETRAGLVAALLKGLDAALDALADARAEEGASLAGVLTTLLNEIEAHVAAAGQTAGAQPERIRARLSDAVSALLDRELDPDRLAAEVAILAVKADVREELDRLQAHIASARALLNQEGPCGRKLDFLTQEFMREANTLCSKSADPALTGAGLALKAAVDQFREQVQNVE